MHIERYLGGTTCAKCGALKLARPDGGVLCSDCERKMSEEFATKVRPDIGKKGKVEVRWRAQMEEENDDTIIFEE